MNQPRIPQPPTTWADYRNGAAACLKHMSPEGQQRARDFWQLRPPTEPKPARRP
ncbi:hypothetical protein ACVWYF_004169 [Hymenobacter sp. UYAg731]